MVVFSYVDNLPNMLHATFDVAMKGDMETNVGMKVACVNSIEVVEYMLIQLSRWFPPRHFGGNTGEEYFSKFVAERHIYRLALEQPHGEAEAGRESYIHAAHAVLRDVCSAVSELVLSLCLYMRDYDVDQWRRRWAAATEHFKL